MRESSPPGCPSLAALIRAIGGVLLPEEAEYVQSHVETCASCQEEMRLYVAAEEEAVRELARSLPGRQRHADDHEERAVEFAQRLVVRKQAERHIDEPRAAFLRWWQVIAVPAALIVVFLILRTHSTVVRAEALLDRVATESHTAPAGLVQKVRIQLRPIANGSWSPPSSVGSILPTLRMEPVSVTREVVDGFAIAPGTEPPTASFAPPGALARVLDLQPVDWQHPLGIDHLRAWRRSLTDKQDSISYIGSDVIVLRTTTTQGVLREVTVTVRLDSYRVIKQSLVFEGLGRVEIEELAQWRRPVEPSRPATQVAANESADATAAESAPVDADTLDRAELDARHVLRDTDLDLRDDVHISRARDEVRVDSGVASATLGRDISARLTKLEHVRPALRVQPLANGTARAAAGMRPELSQWTARKFQEGTRPRTMFVPELERIVGTVSRRLSALQELAQRYPETVVQHLAPEAKSHLRDLVNRHYAALTADLEDLDARIAVINGGSTDRCVLATAAPSDWTQRAATGLEHARALERVVQQLLTFDDLPADLNDPQSAVNLGATFSALWDSVNLVRPASS